jgi:hypothetical protein
MLLVNLAACFLLSYITLWYFVFVPSAVLGFWTVSRWTNLAYFGVTGAIGAILPIFLSDVSVRIGNAAILASAVGLPGGAGGILAITAIIAFLISGMAAVLTSSIRDSTS